ncbi:hypothetical protein [Pseudomonas sp.]|uniref:hypothetical protein n=1 Tax=Pseudomonas sp. TaxID=306 RepID=UPI00262E8C84|nr:hypothetical protein [Pseudomonas sp.]
MTDKTELKRLADAANAVMGDVRVDVAIASESGPNQAEIDAVTSFFQVATPAAVLALFAENERFLKLLERMVEQYVPLTELEGVPGWSRVVELVEVVAQRDQLKTEVERLKTENQSEVGACLLSVAENKKLKAENEALHDDIEQNQYDANAWRNSEESVWIEVFNSEGDDPFISAITGQITIEQLTLIQAEILEYREDYFEKGSGLYVFKCRHCQAHHDNVGMTEPAHWETDFESYSPFPWEEEVAATTKEQSHD